MEYSCHAWASAPYCYFELLDNLILHLAESDDKRIYIYIYIYIYMVTLMKIDIYLGLDKLRYN